MAEPFVDPVVAAILIAISGIVLWAVTQVHLLRVARALKKDIDDKRSSTEDFVKKQLLGLKDGLEIQIAGFEARVHAEIPPNVHGELEEIRAELNGKVDAALERIQGIDNGINAALAQLDTELQGLPQQIKMVYLSEKGVATRDLHRLAGEAASELTDLAQAELDAYDTNPMAAEFMAWMRKPIDPELEARSPIEAMIVRAGKAALGERLAPRFLKGKGAAASGGSGEFTPVR